MTLQSIVLDDYVRNKLVYLSPNGKEKHSSDYLKYRNETVELRQTIERKNLEISSLETRTRELIHSQKGVRELQRENEYFVSTINELVNANGDEEVIHSILSNLSGKGIDKKACNNNPKELFEQFDKRRGEEIKHNSPTVSNDKMNDMLDEFDKALDVGMRKEKRYYKNDVVKGLISSSKKLSGEGNEKNLIEYKRKSVGAELKGTLRSSSASKERNISIPSLVETSRLKLKESFKNISMFNDERIEDDLKIKHVNIRKSIDNQSKQIKQNREHRNE
jgi:hypothetical protein